MSRLGGAAVMAVALALTGCSSDTSSTTATTTPAAAKKDTALGDPVEFKRADNQQTVGTIRILEVAAVPDECLFTPGHVIAVRAEITNPGELFLPKPDTYGLTVVDAGGATQKVEPVSIRSSCGLQEIAPSQPGGKTSGWETVAIHDPNPTALTYAPIVAEPDSTVSNMKFVTVTPKYVRVALPNPLPTAAIAAATTTPAAAPAPETTQVPQAPSKPAPAVGKACDIDSDTWAKSASGQQLRCAYAGGPSPKWVASAPFIGIRTPGSPCQMNAGVAESPDGQVLVCTGGEGPMTWQPGP